MDSGILVFVLDLIAAFFNAPVNVSLAPRLGLVAAPTDGKKKNRIRAAVEMLMKPHLGRHEHTPRPPFDALHRFAFLPHERVAGAANNQHVNARAVTVRLLVSPHAPK